MAPLARSVSRKTNQAVSQIRRCCQGTEEQDRLWKAIRRALLLQHRNRSRSRQAKLYDLRESVRHRNLCQIATEARLIALVQACLRVRLQVNIATCMIKYGNRPFETAVDENNFCTKPTLLTSERSITLVHRNDSLTCLNNFDCEMNIFQLLLVISQEIDGKETK